MSTSQAPTSTKKGTNAASAVAIELSSDQIDALTVAEKVRVLEQVWQSLCCRPDSIASPDWHADVLMERRQRLLDGSATSIPRNEAKAQLQKLAE